MKVVRRQLVPDRPDPPPEPKARISERRPEFNGRSRRFGRPMSGPERPFCQILLAEPASAAKAWFRARFKPRSMLWHGNLDAIVASHQDTILGPAQMGNTHGQPDADRQKSDGECAGCDIRQHPLPVIIDFLGDALIARQVVGDLKPMHKRRLICPLGEGRPGARPEWEHPVLLFLRGRCDRSLGSHGCQLQGSSALSSTPALHRAVKIKIASRAHSSKVSWNLL